MAKIIVGGWPPKCPEDYFQNIEYISSDIEYIEDRAFAGKQMDCVIFKTPSKVKEIRSSAFEGCDSLKYIKIPASVEIIEDSAFKNCSSLQDVLFEENSKLRIIDGGIVHPKYLYGPFPSWVDCYHLAYDSYMNCIELDDISCGAFWGCGLSTINIPASVEEIGIGAFGNCPFLSHVVFEKGSNLAKILSHWALWGNWRISIGAFGYLYNPITIDATACTKLISVGEDIFSGDSYGLYNKNKPGNHMITLLLGTEIPPEIAHDHFLPKDNQCTLKVPSQSVEAYKNAKGWNEFANITSLKL